MRHIDPVGARLALSALVLAGATVAAGAAPFDFLFERTPPPSAPTRARRGLPHRPPTPRPSAAAEIPLPVPRPHFADDRPVAPDVATKDPLRPAEAKSAEPTVAESAGTPPLPPPKPAELETPSAPATAHADHVEPAQHVAPPPKSAEVAKPLAPSPPAASPPAVAPSGATTAFVPLSPDDDPQCPGRLVARHVAVASIVIGPQPDERCTVVEAVRLTELTMPDGGTVAFPDHPTIACTTADAFSSFVRDLMVPLAKGTFGSPVQAIWTGPGLECRSRDHIFGAKLSAHGQGLAIDIAQLKLADGRVIEVGDPKSDTETGFESASRAGACGYFHTVLGPGSDAYHRTHWHFDLEVRGSKGDGKYCK